MHNFPAWMEKNGEIRFLIDDEIEYMIAKGDIEYWVDNMCYSAIRKFYNLSTDWKECCGFDCPLIVATAIQDGEMTYAMEAARIIEIHFDADGKLHKDNGPAIIYADGTYWWMKHGVPHRIDGPACYGPTWTIPAVWYVDGVEMTEKEFSQWRHNNVRP